MKRELIVKKRGVLVLTAISLFVVFNTLKSVYTLNIDRSKGISNLERTSKVQSSNAKLKLKLSNAKYIFLVSDYKDSLRNYTNTLELNPVLIQAWLGISELLIDENKKNEALAILQHVKSITPYSNYVHWDLSLLLLRINENELAIKTLITVAENNYWQRDDVFRIFDKLQIDKKYLIDNLKSGDLISSYLEHLLSNGLVNESTYLWDFMASNNIAIEQNIRNKYIEFLIWKNMFKQAYSIWSEGHDNIEVDNLIWNGDFEYEIENKGFNWRISNIEEVDIEIDNEKFYSGSKSLKLVFNGKKNINFYHVKKHIPVEQGKSYSLSYAYSSRDVTTKSGVFWELKCNDSKLLNKTDVILGSNKWKRNEFEFETAEDCEGVSLVLRRNPIRKLDSKISGAVWFDDLRLKALN
jgi:hypothetical protein